jgi:hypothetical protein
MTLRQERPVVACMPDKTSAGFDEPLLQAGQRPVTDRLGKRMITRRLEVAIVSALLLLAEDRNLG